MYVKYLQRFFFYFLYMKSLKQLIEIKYNVLFKYSKLNFNNNYEYDIFEIPAEITFANNDFICSTRSICVDIIFAYN